MRWYDGAVKSDDICVGDVNAFKTVEYWESKKFRTKETEPNDTIEREKDISKTIFTRGEIDESIKTHRNKSRKLNLDLERIDFFDNKGRAAHRFRVKKQK